MLMDTVTGWIRKLTEAGVAAIALAVVVQVIFGSGAAFLPGDVIANLTSLVNMFGTGGFTGLIVLIIVAGFFIKK